MTRALPALLLAVALVGCPGKSDAPSDAGIDAGVTVSAVELCDRLSVARCQLLQSCYPAFERESAEGCRTAEQSRCLARYESLRESFDEGKVSVRADALVRCEQRMSGESCPATFPPGYPSATVPFADCELGPGLLSGTVPSGETCRDAVECADGTVCFKPNGVCLGTCSAPPADGEPCAFGCAAGLFCDDRGTLDPNDDRCGPLRAVDGACVDSSQCAPDLVCTGGVCRARGHAGDSCTFDPLRASTCAPGLACDVTPFVASATGTCVAPRGIAEPCQFHWSCEKGLVCGGLDWSVFPDTSPPPGTCLPPQAEGGSCVFTPFGSYVGETCEGGEVCAKTNSCTKLGARGESCIPGTSSCSGVDVFCKPSPGGATGTCSGPVGIGETCGVRIDDQRTFFIPCSSGYCDPTTLACRAADKALGELCTSDAECSSSRCAVQQDRTLRCAPACD